MIGLAIAALAALTAHPACGLMFRCGCVLSAAHCNVHHATGPRCPWCTSWWHFPAAGAIWVLFIVLAGRMVRERSKPTQLAARVLALFAGQLVSGALTFALTDYPRFLWFQR